MLFAESVLGEKLSRANEMLLGAILPFSLLLAYEVHAKLKGINESEDYKIYLEKAAKDTEEEEVSAEQNTFGIKVLATTLFVVGVLILVLGFMTAESRTVVLMVGTMILFVAGFIHPSFKKRLKIG